MTTPRSGAQAVGLAVLRCVAAADAGLGSTELAQRAGLSVSTAHALAEDGLLIQDPKAARYRLGPALVVLGKRQSGASATRRRCRCSRNWPRSPASPSTSASAPATTCHVVLDVMSRQPLRFEQELGSRVPVHTSAMGKCLLANNGDLDEEVKRLGELAQAAVAAPVPRPDGGVVDAIAIQGPTVRLTDDRPPDVVTPLESTTQRVTIGL